MSSRQRVPDFYEPPVIELWAAIGALACGVMLGFVRWQTRRR